MEISKKHSFQVFRGQSKIERLQSFICINQQNCINYYYNTHSFELDHREIKDLM